MKLGIVLIIVCCCVFGTHADSPYRHSQVTTTPLKVLSIEEHNSNWFTQGLFKEPNAFYISSGLYGKSALILQQLSPPLTQRYLLPKHYFAEGLTVIGDRLYLLSWKEQTLFIFDKTNLSLIKKVNYKGEGWGLTHRPTRNDSAAEFIMSNGSDTLYFRDLDNFNIQRQLTIKGLNLLNELEYHDGIVWANRWYDNHLYGIDSNNGCIVAKVDLLPLRKQAGKITNKNVVNGIAYDEEKKGLWVTGKLWSKRFLIEIPTINRNNC